MIVAFPGHTHLLFKGFYQISIGVTTNLDAVICLFCFVALRPKSTAMVMAGRSVHLTTLFPGQA